MKGKRQQEILRIIEEQDIDTQDQLLAELRGPADSNLPRRPFPGTSKSCI